MWKTICSYLEQQSAQIASQPILRAYGFLLSALHLLSIYFWSYLIWDLGETSAYRYCWPFALNCNTWKITGVGLWLGLTGLYLALAVVTPALFLFQKRIRLACLLLFVLNLVKYFILIQDYRLMGNYHYMPFVVTLIFLFLPDKTKLIQLFLIFFYVAAGFLKLNYEWLSGSLLTNPPDYLRLAFPYACAYVVLLETVLAWGLLARAWWIRWAVLVQFIAFHVISYHWVGYFYPLIMGSLLAIFPLAWFSSSTATPFRWHNLTRWSWATIVFFWSCQTIPSFYKGDPAVTTQGRLFALNMYDARTECVRFGLLRFKNSSEEIWTDDTLSVRIHCDPAVILAKAKFLCQEMKKRQDFVEADLFLASKRSTDLRYTTLIDMHDVCAKNPEFHLVQPNVWTDL